ncbi:hypothetical protein L2E82_13226 [Cichorium intybus]|uniref:Uncharacterized protein n=1 Tax=Cichorium intybus TaxID=13427 RepID=A0ACB9GK92_CICIN|nr:hypothetical protein L2E82_13226 [Cichorium intybus]
MVEYRSQATNNNTTTSYSASDFVLQWGNRKQLRCVKVQQQQAKDKESAAAAIASSGTPPVGQQSITARVDLRVVKSPNHQNKETVTTNAVSNGHGYINLRQRSSSPAHRVLRLNWKHGLPILKEHIANRLASPGQGKELIAKSKNCGTDPRVEVLQSLIAINLSEIVEGVDSYNLEHQSMQALLRGIVMNREDVAAYIQKQNQEIERFIGLQVVILMLS